MWWCGWPFLDHLNNICLLLCLYRHNISSAFSVTCSPGGEGRVSSPYFSWLLSYVNLWKQKACYASVGAREWWKKAWGPAELQLQAACLTWVLWSDFGPPGRAASALRLILMLLSVSTPLPHWWTWVTSVWNSVSWKEQGLSLDWQMMGNRKELTAVCYLVTNRTWWWLLQCALVQDEVCVHSPPHQHCCSEVPWYLKFPG